MGGRRKVRRSPFLIERRLEKVKRSISLQCARRADAKGPEEITLQILGRSRRVGGKQLPVESDNSYESSILVLGVCPCSSCAEA